MAVLVCVAGDVMLDVLVATPGPMQPDDDTPARVTLGPGGQAANVAAWVRHLGQPARLYGPRSRDAVGAVLDAQLLARGIELAAEPDSTRSGVVVSLATGGTRTMASDPGGLAWISGRLADPAWLSGAAWLHLSGYLLLRAPDPDLVRTVGRVAHACGARVSVDLSSAAMIATYGAGELRALVEDLEPAVVFGNAGEWQALRVDPYRWGPDAVLKRGAQGCLFVRDGRATELAVVPGDVRDVTGAGDALAAGYLVGGPERAMLAAAECVSQIGAQPAP